MIERSGTSDASKKTDIRAEARESARVTANTITGSELAERIYRNQSLPQDHRFQRMETGGAFKYFHPEKMLRRAKNLFYSTVSEEDTVVGLAELEKSPYEDNLYWMTFLSVDPQFQERGHSKRLIDEMFRFAEARGIDLEISKFTEQGEQRIRRQIEERAKTSPIRVTYSAPPSIP